MAICSFIPFLVRLLSQKDTHPFTARFPFQFASLIDCEKQIKFSSYSFSVCILCGQTLIQNSQFANSIQIEMISQTCDKICPFCSKPFSPNEIKKHIGINHFGLAGLDFEGKLTVNDCSKSYKSMKIELEFQINQIKEKEHETEEQLKDVSHDSQNSQTVLKDSNEETDRKVNCDHCGKSYPTMTNLKRHIKEIHKGLKATCNICNKKISSSALQQHIMAIHNGLRLNCDECEKTVSDKRNLNRHVREIHGVKSFECKECAEFFSSKRNLERHENRNHDKHKTKCDHCDKSYRGTKNLKIHIKRSHQGLFRL